MTATKESALANLHHLDLTQLWGRAVNLMPLWENEKWNLWVPTPNGELIKLQPIDAVQSTYWGKSCANDEDMLISLLDTMWQRLSFPEIVPLIKSISDDFQLLATSAAKLEYFYKAESTVEKNLAASFVKSEIEYTAIVARSLFDLTQETIAKLWNDHVSLEQPATEPRRLKRKLPVELAKVLYESANARSASDIKERFDIPAPLAEAYVRHEKFFSALRAHRDKVVHGIGSSSEIFVTEKGFSISPTSEPFRRYSWDTSHHYNEELVSLKPWFAHVILGTIDACSELVNSFLCHLDLPGEIAPGYRVILRDPSNGALGRLMKTYAGQDAWWDSRR